MTNHRPSRLPHYHKPGAVRRKCLCGATAAATGSYTEDIRKCGCPKCIAQYREFEYGETLDKQAGAG